MDSDLDDNTFSLKCKRPVSEPLNEYNSFEDMFIHFEVAKLSCHTKSFFATDKDTLPHHIGAVYIPSHQRQNPHLLTPLQQCILNIPSLVARVRSQSNNELYTLCNLAPLYQWRKNVLLRTDPKVDWVHHVSITKLVAHGHL